MIPIKAQASSHKVKGLRLFFAMDMDRRTLKTPQRTDVVDFFACVPLRSQLLSLQDLGAAFNSSPTPLCQLRKQRNNGMTRLYCVYT